MSEPTTITPAWDGPRRELRWGDFILKRIRQGGRDQVRLLEAFARQQWAQRVHRPLPRKGRMSVAAYKAWLHRTITNLNRHHRLRLIRFGGDGTGEGVLWHLVMPDDYTI